MARLPARVAPRLGALCAAAACAAAAWAATAAAWTPPTAIYANAAPQVLAVAGDPAGNAFAVYEGGTLDTPLLLSERSVEDPRADTASLAWTSPRPLPGYVEAFTNGAPALSAATAAASGEGAGAIVLRYGDALMTALVREPGFEFTPPASIAGGGTGRLDPPSVAVADNGATLIAFHAAGERAGSGRVLYAFKPSGSPFNRLASLATSDGPQPVAAQAVDGWPVVAWTNKGSVSVVRVDDRGRPTAPQKLGATKQRGPLTAAVGTGGGGLVAWIDDEGYVRLVRRSAPGAFSWSLPIHRAPGWAMSDLTSAVDPIGRAFVAWRETRGSSRRLLVAQAPVGGSFRMTTIARGGDLGRPVITARPDGGAAVAWPSAAGWKAVTATAAKFGEARKISDPLAGQDRDGTEASLIAGPGLRVELVWRQQGDVAPQTGPVVYAASDSGT